MSSGKLAENEAVTKGSLAEKWSENKDGAMKEGKSY